MANDNIRKQALTAAQKLFQEQGLGVITMEDIAKAIGKGKSTLYYYFKSKEDIFNAVLETEVNDIIIETMKQVNRKDDLPEKLEVFAFIKYDMTYKKKSLHNAMEAGLDADALSGYVQLKKGIHLQYLQKEKLVLQQLLISSMEKNEIRKLNNMELDELILIFLSSLRGINREAINHETVKDTYGVITLFCKLFYKGLK